MMTFYANSLEELEDVAAKLRLLGAKVYLLEGAMGTGKTTLVSTIMKGLSPAIDMVISPTFSLHNTYTVGKKTFLHTDLYRVNSLTELETTGFYELLEEADTAFIEWADKLPLKIKDSRRVIITRKGSKRIYDVLGV